MANSDSSGSEQQTWKLVLVGDGNTGRKSLIKVHLEAESGRKYLPTLGAYKLAGLREGYYANASCAIIMFDVSSQVTYKNVPLWHKDIKWVSPDIPIVVCGNKVDVPEAERQVKPKDVTFHRGREAMQYYDISVKSRYNVEQPFLWLARAYRQG
ncbi:hypothetical protein ABW20_dc0109617 [Dactylellina cionopaga]|nr:hypothetical protein ABW20_dc0109617 [Dactylellina cionopaga]